jgi:hypothetical protein
MPAPQPQQQQNVVEGHQQPVEEAQHQQRQQQKQQVRLASKLAVEKLCGGAASVPPVAEALADSSHALERGPGEALAPWGDAGFTLEDLMATADALGIDGTHDTMVWVEVGGLPAAWGLLTAICCLAPTCPPAARQR